MKIDEKLKSLMQGRTQEDSEEDTREDMRTMLAKGMSQNEIVMWWMDFIKEYAEKPLSPKEYQIQLQYFIHLLYEVINEQK